MSLDENFQKAAEAFKNLKTMPSNDVLLEIYALYKQATVGDNNNARSGLDIEGQVKWKAWSHKKGLAQSKAKEEYVAKVSNLIPTAIN